MSHAGNIRKMRTQLADKQVQYYLPIGATEVPMNARIGHTISINFTSHINCIKCGAQTKKSFAQGYCYPCFSTAPETEECVLKPELCRAHEGVARDMEYAQKHCLTDQIVYLAVSSGLKVGVTRQHQVPTRWIDQGASFALAIARVPNRYTAGVMEVALKEHYGDRTAWQRMLKNEIAPGVDLLAERKNAMARLPLELQQHFLADSTITQINYPVTAYPTKVKAINLDKQPMFTGTLVGIKGQYLIFDGGMVLNIRKFGGYYIELV